MSDRVGPFPYLRLQSYALFFKYQSFLRVFYLNVDFIHTSPHRISC